MDSLIVTKCDSLGYKVKTDEFIKTTEDIVELIPGNVYWASLDNLHIEGTYECFKGDKLVLRSGETHRVPHTGLELYVQGTYSQQFDRREISLKDLRSIYPI